MSEEVEAPQPKVILRQGYIVYHLVAFALWLLYGVAFLLGIVAFSSSWSVGETLGYLFGGCCALGIGIGGMNYKLSCVIAEPEGLIFQNLWRKVTVRWNEVDAFVYEGERLTLLNLAQGKTLLSLDLSCHEIKNWWPVERRNELVRYAKTKLEEVEAEKISAAWMKIKLRETQSKQQANM